MEATLVQSLCLLILLPGFLAVDIPSVTLKNAAKPGMKMPAHGLGTGGYAHHPEDGPGEMWNDSVAVKAVKEWLMLGGRRIDNANSYMDEVGVGEAMRASSIPRADIFLTSKISLVGYNETLMQMKTVLSDLQMDYVDLLLIHWPAYPPNTTTDPACQGDPTTLRGCRQSVWKAMEVIFKSGQALAIGVSNYEKKHIEDILVMNSTVPSVNQVEYHPYWHEDDLVEYCKSLGILFNSYSPLGAPDIAPIVRKWNGTIMELPVIETIAKAHQRTAAQVILKWQWQQGIVVNPRTWNKEHMKENVNFFDFELTDEEMKQISSITPPFNPKMCPDPNNMK